MPLDILMTDAEQVLLKGFFCCARDYVEFGCGGSTVLAASLVGRSVISIDSSRAWLAKVAENCAAAQTPIQPVFVHADIGAVGHLGYPPNEDCKDIWPNYHAGVWEDGRAANADTFLIDGRFRVACFLQALLRGTAGAIVMIHDYADRSYYHAVTAYADEIARAGTLSAFQRKRAFDPVLAVACLQQHWFDNR